MPRDIDDRKKRKALRKLRLAAELAEQGLGPPLSDWETAFLEEVETRIETYGSAFADPSKGDLGEPLSALQARKLKEIDKKARGKGGGLKARKPLRSKPARARVRDVNEDAPPQPETKQPDAPPPARGKPVLRVIKGGADD